MQTMRLSTMNPKFLIGIWRPYQLVFNAHLLVPLAAAFSSDNRWLLAGKSHFIHNVFQSAVRLLIVLSLQPRALLKE